MTNEMRAKKNISTTEIKELSLNFELAKLKNRIYANCAEIGRNNLYIFSKDNMATA